MLRKLTLHIIVEEKTAHNLSNHRRISTHELRLPVAVPHLLELSADASGEHHRQEGARHDVEQRRLRRVHQEQRYESRNQTQGVD